MLKAERETVINWDRETDTVRLYTADPVEARRWTRLGYQVTASSFARNGQPRGWKATGPAKCVRVRRLVDGVLPKRGNGTQRLPVQGQFQKRTFPSLPPRPGAKSCSENALVDEESGNSDARRQYSEQRGVQ